MVDRSGRDDESAAGDGSAAQDPATPQYAGERSRYDGRDELSILYSDDALLDALGGAEHADAEDIGERELDELLLAWRRDIDSEPVGELIDTDTAVATVNAAAATERAKGRQRRRKAFVPVAAAAAVLAIAFTGTGLAARSAEPGDALWNLTQVLYTDHAQSVQAAASARLELDTANDALTQGRVSAARDALTSASRAIERVAPEDHLGQLKAEHRHLAAQLEHPRDGADENDQNGTSAESTSSTTTPTADESSSSRNSTTSEPSESSSTSESETPTSSTSPTSESSPPAANPTSGSGDSGTETDRSPNRHTAEPHSSTG